MIANFLFFLKIIRVFKKHNILKALFIIVKRISRCHPWGKSGDDPVPD